MPDILNYSIFSNTALQYLTALGLFLGGMAIGYVFKKYILSRLKKLAVATETTIDDFLIVTIEKSLIPIIYFGVFYIALHTLNLSEDFKHGLTTAAIVLITVLAVRAIISMVNFGLQSYIVKSADSAVGEKQLKGIRGL
ncbi:MAG: mechanosensitive ion channel protein MscS, partial [Betaproteobacteria bacterium HGW-Betaproteobacteria-20]